MNADIKEKLKDIKLFVTDFDGVHTDGFVYFEQHGIETVRCSRRDSLGINMLKRHGISVCVISKEENPVVSARCRKIAVACYHRVEDGGGKREILERITNASELLPKNVLYMGDDINDRSAMEYAGVSVAVNDCHPELKRIPPTFVTKRCGGDHAIREVSDMVLQAQGIDISKY